MRERDAGGGPLWGRYQGEWRWLGDLLMEIPKSEWCNIEIEQPDGSLVRPWRFNDPDPHIGTDEDGILTIS
jgi:hypothetical protein